jgi:hypothetical protein
MSRLEISIYRLYCDISKQRWPDMLRTITHRPETFVEFVRELSRTFSSLILVSVVSLIRVYLNR